MKYKLSVIIMVLSLFFMIFCSQCGKAKKKSMPYSESFTVKHLDLKDVIIQTGEVRPVVKVEVKSEASGRIEKVYVKEGQRVLKDEKLIDIDPSRLLYQKERLDLTLKKARIEKSIAKRNYDNALKLQKTGTISFKNLADLKGTYDLADITYQEKKLERTDITDQLAKTVVRSPINGVITTLEVEEGEIAISATSGFQAGTAIATIADITKLEVVSQIGEVDFIHLKHGQKVVIKSESTEGVTTSGTISFIALSAKKLQQDELGTFEVRINVDSLIPGIAPGINVNVEFVILDIKGVLGIPNHFVTKTAKGYFVTLGNENSDNKNEKKQDVPKQNRVKIEIGSTDYKHYEVTSGLKMGDTVLYIDEPITKEKRNKRKTK